MDVSNVNAVYRSNGRAYYEINGIPDLTRTLLFLPQLKEEILLPFAGIIEAANHSYRFRNDSPDFSLVYNNLEKHSRDKAGGPIGPGARSRTAVSSNIRDR